MKYGTEEFEEVEYEPTSVKDLLVEMKDISEIMVDLAYSAIIFDSDAMAEEVRKLEKRMDTLNYRIRMMAMIGSRTKRDAEALSGILQVASAAESISNAAGDIVDLLEQEIETRPFIPFVLQNADEKIKTLKLSKDSTMVGRTIEELGVEAKTGMRIIALRRRKRWAYDPPPETRLKGGDVLIVRGTDDGFNRLSEYAKGLKPWPGVG